jgi:hypothetical protein
MNDTTPLDTPPQPEPTARRRGVLRPILIGVGSAVAVLLVAAGGVAIAGIADDDRLEIRSSDRPVAVAPSSGSSTAPSPTASNSSRDDGPISSEEYDAVSAAALAAVGGGTVTDLKRDDDPDHAWEVDIRLDNGNEAEVDLAADLSVVRINLDD